MTTDEMTRSWWYDKNTPALCPSPSTPGWETMLPTMPDVLLIGVCMLVWKNKM